MGFECCGALELGGNACLCLIYMTKCIMRSPARTGIVVLGELGGRGVQCNNNVCQPIGRTESYTQSHLAYVGKSVATIHKTSTEAKDENAGSSRLLSGRRMRICRS
jgi:hypothetical protein